MKKFLLAGLLLCIGALVGYAQDEANPEEEPVSFTTTVDGLTYYATVLDQAAKTVEITEVEGNAVEALVIPTTLQNG